MQFADHGTDLKRPTLVNGELSYVQDKNAVLLPEAELKEWLETEGKKYVWDKNPVDLGENKDEEGQRIYVGHK